MDLLYYESPPGLQFLNCLEASGMVGGEGTFLDAFKAAKVFKETRPEMFEILSRVPATFICSRHEREVEVEEDKESFNEKANSAASMLVQRPHFQVTTEGDIVGVFWAPQFEGPLVCAPQDVRPYYEAHAAFHSFLEEGSFAVGHTLKKTPQVGHCVMFNNRRMLHGRKAFSSGKRVLEGCYVSLDDATSRLGSLHIKMSSLDPLKNQLCIAGNGSNLPPGNDEPSSC
ncbi:unnamed protein product [Discosporangium mesarthrocarpum]